MTLLTEWIQKKYNGPVPCGQRCGCGSSYACEGIRWAFEEDTTKFEYCFKCNALIAWSFSLRCWLHDGPCKTLRGV